MILPYLIAVLGTILILLAILGIIIPIIPGGPILAYLGLLLWHILIPETTSPLGEKLSTVFITGLGVIHVLAVVGDFLVPVIGGKFFKFSKAGIWGSIIGTILGLFFFPPFPPLGIVVGSIIGTFLGEMYNKKDLKNSLRVSSYAVLINAIVFILKLVLTMITAYYFFTQVIRYFF